MPRIDYIGLEFDNAYIYKRCALPLKDQGLVLVRGLNLDDGGYLGAGKSSIFEVFSQVQVGKGGKNEVRGGVTKDDVVNNFVGSDFCAKLSLAVDGRPFEIIQYRRHARYGNKLLVVDKETGENILPKDQLKSPHKWIREVLLGIDEITFFNLIYLAQEFSTIMVHGTEADRRKQLTQMFNLHVYDDLYETTRKLLDVRMTSAADFDTLQAELQDIGNRLAELPNMQEVEGALTEAKNTLTLLSSRVEAEMAEYTELTQRQANVKLRRDLILEVRKIFEKVKFSPDITKPQDITTVYVEGLKKIYDNVYAEFVTVTNALENATKKSDIENELKRLVGREAEVVQQELAETKSKIRVLQTVDLPQAEEKVEVASDLQRIGKPSTDLKTVEDEYNAVMLEESGLKNKISVLHSQVSTEVCPTCHRPFNMNASELRELESKLEDQRRELEIVTKRLHELKRRKEQTSKYIRLLEKYKTLTGDRSPEDIQSEIVRLSKTEKTLTNELEQANRRRTLQGQLKSLPAESKDELEHKAAHLRIKLDAATARYNTAKEVLDRVQNIVKLPSGNLDEIEIRLEELNSSLKGASDALASANKKVSDLSGVVDEYRRLSRRKTVLVDTLTKKAALLNEIACLKSLKKAFDPQGLKQDRFRAILLDATQRTVPAYANIMWPNGSVLLGVSDKEGSVQFQMERSNITTGSSLLSGGERHKAGLAFLFGMRDLKELYTGCSTNVLVVDEPFGSLDPQGTENLISIFELLKKRFDTIFVISHRPEVLEHPVWDQTWWVIRERNNATLYQGEPPAKYKRIATELVKH